MRIHSKWLVRGLVCLTIESAVRKLAYENSHDASLKIRLSLLRGLMYITSLSMDDCK